MHEDHAQNEKQIMNRLKRSGEAKPMKSVVVGVCSNGHPNDCGESYAIDIPDGEDHAEGICDKCGIGIMVFDNKEPAK